MSSEILTTERLLGILKSRGLYLHLTPMEKVEVGPMNHQQRTPVLMDVINIQEHYDRLYDILIQLPPGTIYKPTGKEKFS